MADERAIIDVGSNTVRLVIYGGPPRAPLVLHNEKVTAKLGKSVGETGRLGPKASALARSALARYATLLNLRGVADVTTVATAAVRDAANGPAFLEAVRTLGLNPRLLSGEDEALAAAFGVIAAFPGARGAVADLGGGSLELTAVGAGGAHHGTSLPLGTLRLPALRAQGTAKFARLVRGQIAKAPLADTSGAPLYLVGGSCRAMARLLMRKMAWPLDDPHGFTLPFSTALRQFQALASGRLGSATSGIPSSRLAAMPDAAALMAAVVRELQPSMLVFSSWGLREGLLYQTLADELKTQDPLVAGVGAFAEGLGVSVQLGAIVAGWTSCVTARDMPAQEELRLASILLSLAALHIEPNLRADHALDWALRKRWVGVDAQGRALMAMTALANFGRTEVPAALACLAPADALHQAVSWGLALRLCRRLGGLGLRSLSSMALEYDQRTLRLSLHEPAATLFTEAAEKDLRMLAIWLDCPFEVV